jgi:hypothetical protein
MNAHFACRHAVDEAVADDVAFSFLICFGSCGLTPAAVPGVDVVLLCASLPILCCHHAYDRLSSAMLATTCCKSMFVHLHFFDVCVAHQLTRSQRIPGAQQAKLTFLAADDSTVSVRIFSFNVSQKFDVVAPAT